MRDPVQILVVDDDAFIRAMLQHAFETEGFQVSECDDKTTLFHALEAHDFDLITLDLNLGQDDGLALARQIRATRNIPIIMITARGSPFDRVTGLEHGADDYIPKPFHVREVIHRAKSVLHRYELMARESAAPGFTETIDSQRFAFDHGVLDLAKREVRKIDGTLVDLTDIEFQILKLFVTHPARVLSRDEISQYVRNRDWSPLDRTLDGHVSRLRKKVAPIGEPTALIKSVRGVGYVFTGDVTTA